MLNAVGLLALVCAASAAVYRWPPREKPEDFANQPGCYLEHLHRVLQYNVYFYPNTDCARYLCLPDSNETIYETCGVVQVHDGCRLTAVDLRNSYPYCCGREACDVTTTQAPSTTQAPTSATEVPSTTTQAPTITQASTTTTQVPDTSTTQASTTTEAPTSATEVPSTTTQAPTTSAQVPARGPLPPPPPGSQTFASASSVSGQPPHTRVVNSGPNARATASAL